MTQLDHIMFACADLQAGIDEIYELTGVMPAPGGSHPGVGTRNALLSLDNRQYLEIIAPDPAQDLAGTTGQLLLDHGGSGIRSWAVASDNLSEVASQAAALELDSREIIDMSRTTPEGAELAWRLLFLKDSHMPFFIDWLESPHPALSTPSGCTLERFNITTPTPAVYQGFLDALDLPLNAQGGAPAFSAQLSTPNGIVTLEPW